MTGAPAGRIADQEEPLQSGRRTSRAPTLAPGTLELVAILGRGVSGERIFDPL